MGSTADLVIKPNFVTFGSLPGFLTDYLFEIGFSENNESFSMSSLRLLYKTDKDNFKLIVFGLSLYGFSFHSKKNNSFFPTDVLPSDLIIHCKNDVKLSVFEMIQNDLADIFKYFPGTDLKYLNGAILDRLEQMTHRKLSDFLLLRGCTMEPAGYYLSDKQKQQPFIKQIVRNRTMISQQSDLRPEPAKTAPEKEPIYFQDVPLAGYRSLCIPIFFLKFICSLLSSPSEAISTYQSLGYRTYGDFLNADVGLIHNFVESAKNRGLDSYLLGVCELNLVSFFSDRQIFMEKRGLELVPSNFYTAFHEESPFKDFDVLYVPLDSNPSLVYRLDDRRFSSVAISTSQITYLKRFGINSLLLMTGDILIKPIDRYRLSDDKYGIAPLLSPYNVVDEIVSSMMGVAPHNPFGIDKEFSIVGIEEQLSAYYLNLDNLDKRMISIVKERESGLTLEEISVRYSLTRERIRQLVAKFATKEKNICGQTANFVIGHCELVPICALRKWPGLIAYIKEPRNEANFVLNKELGLAMKKTECAETNAAISRLIKTKERITCVDVYSFFLDKHVCLYGFFNSSSSSLEYNPYPSFIFKKKSLYAVGAEYLLSKGLNGYQINDDEEEAIDFFAYNCPSSAGTNYRALSNDILRSGSVLRRISTYVSPSLVTEQMKHAVEVVLDGTNLGQYGQTGQTLFYANKALLTENGVDDPYFLYGIVSYFFADKYNCSGRGMRIFGGKKIPLDLLVIDYMNLHGPIVKEKELLESVHIAQPAIEQLACLSKFDNSTCVLVNWFNVSMDDFKNAEDFFAKEIDKKGFCACVEILKSPLFFDESINGFMKRNRMSTATRIGYVLDATAKKYGIKKYFFSHHIDAISLSSDPIDSRQGLLKHYFGNKPFTRGEALKTLKSFGLTASISAIDFYSSFAVFLDMNVLTADTGVVPKEEIIGLSKCLKERYGDEYFIRAEEAAARIRINGDFVFFENRPIAIGSFLTWWGDETSWATPINDLSLQDVNYLNVIANKEKFGNKRPKYSELIRKFIFSRKPGSYLSYDDICGLIKQYELTAFKISYATFTTIFNSYIDSGLVEVPNEPEKE